MVKLFRRWRAKREQARLTRLAEQHASDQARQKQELAQGNKLGGEGSGFGQ